MPIAHVCCFAR